MSDDALRILVTGSRLLTDEHKSIVENALIDAADDYSRDLGTYGVTLIEGGASGADRLAARAAALFGWETEMYLAEWRLLDGTLDISAGFKRNQMMVDSGADVCVAFVRACELKRCKRKKVHVTHGTGDCIERAIRAGIPVREIPV